MKKFSLFLFFGLIIRFLLVPQPGFEADIGYWKFWSQVASEQGVVWLTYNTNYNYPPGFALVLWLIGRIYRLFADPQNFQQYWSANNYLFLLLCKLPSILADLLAAWVIFKMLQQPKILGLPEKVRYLSLPFSMIYLFHPVVLLDGAWWGQVDSIGVAFTLLAFYFLFQKKLIPANVFIITGFMLKLQTMIFLPLFFLYVWRNFSWSGLGKSLITSITTFLLEAFPFSFSGNLERTVYLVRQNADWFPVLSLRAFNLWWLYSWGKGLVTSDKILVLGPLKAKTLGLLLFSASYFLACLLIFLKANQKNLIASFVLAGFAFYLFPTQSHDRYIFPALIFLILLLPFYWENRPQRRVILLYFIWLSINTFLNLNISINEAHPGNGIPVPLLLASPFLSIFISATNIFLFLIWLAFVSKNIIYESRIFLKRFS